MKGSIKFKFYQFVQYWARVLFFLFVAQNGTVITQQ